METKFIKLSENISKEKPGNRSKRNFVTVAPLRLAEVIFNIQ